jgi:hypothetical protein
VTGDAQLDFLILNLRAMVKPFAIFVAGLLAVWGGV